MTEKPLIDPIVIPEAEIKIVLDWIKSEQVRTIQNDRTLDPSRDSKIDWLSKVRDNIRSLMDFAENDNKRLLQKNYWIKIENERIRAAAEEAAKTKHCDSFIKCTCEKAF